jgi:nucleotide-binding universal stress UspA family protein
MPHLKGNAAMSTTKTILVPTDFGESANLALDRAIEIADNMRARVALLSVCPIAYVGPIDGALVPSGDVIQSIENADRRGLAEAIALRKSRGVEVIPVWKLGDPRACILETAKETGSELIVMGTHGRRGVARFFLGSTAEAIVRTSPIPVLTLRAPLEASTSELEARSTKQA